MTKRIKLIVLNAFLCLLVAEGYAQEKKIVPQMKGVSTEVVRNVGRIDFTNRRKPIQLGDSVIVNVSWNPQDQRPQAYKNVIIEGVYTPTAEEVKRGKFTVVLKPTKTTYYKVTYYKKNDTFTTAYREVIVLDKKGNPIPGDTTNLDKKIVIIKSLPVNKQTKK